MRAPLGILFIVTGLDRASKAWPLVHKLERFALFPPNAMEVLGFALPWLEFMLGVYLLLGLFTRAIAGAAALLLGFFAFALLVWIVRGETQGCSCTMGTSSNLVANLFLGGASIGPLDVLRDSFLIAACLVLVTIGGETLSVDRLLRRTAGSCTIEV